MEFTNLLEVEQTFDKEDKCIQYLANIRWPTRPICPNCGAFEHINYISSQRVWWCGDCKRQFSVRIGTIFEESRLPLRKWFMAIWMLASSPKDIGAHQLASGIGVARKTAKSMLNRLQGVRSMMQAEDVHPEHLELKQALTVAVQPKTPQVFIDLKAGDCFDIMPDLGSESVHLVVTDPPYHLDGLDGNWRKGLGDAPRGTGTVGGLPVGMKFDPRQGRALQTFMERAGAMMLDTLVPGGFAVVFSQPRLAHRIAAGLEDAGFEIRDLYAWHFTRRAQFKAFGMEHFIDRMDKSPTEKKQLKRHLGGRKTPQLRPQFEAMVLAQKPRQGTFIENYLRHRTGLVNVRATLEDGKVPSSVMTVEKPPKRPGNGHLTVKPVKLMKHLIELFSEPGQVVLDPFLGSGTTAVAAVRTGRACVGIEINPDYITIAEERLQTEERYQEAQE